MRATNLEVLLVNAVDDVRWSDTLLASHRNLYKLLLVRRVTNQCQTIVSEEGRINVVNRNESALINSQRCWQR